MEAREVAILLLMQRTEHAAAVAAQAERATVFSAATEVRMAVAAVVAARTIVPEAKVS
jgi:hypothetical protein